jgi:hypothetical protein
MPPLRWRGEGSLELRSYESASTHLSTPNPGGEMPPLRWRGEGSLELRSYESAFKYQLAKRRVNTSISDSGPGS